MDMFKLLVRSSNLQKTRPDQTSSMRNIPSAGTKVNGNGPEAVEKSSPGPRGIKRKRPGGVAEKDGERKSHVEASHEESAVEEANGNVAEHSTKDGSHAGEGDCRTENGFAAIASEEDRRRSLKNHKLKITILQDSSDLRKRGGNSKISSDRPVKESKRNTRARLFSHPLSSFTELRSRYGISRRLAANLAAQGYREPTAVQMGSLPLLLGSDESRCLPDRSYKSDNKQRSHVDLLTVAPTGSGKTLAFLIPTIQAILETRNKSKQDSGAGHMISHEVKSLIIAPTHELVDQIVNEGRKLASGTGIKVSAMRKGMRLHEGLISDPKDSVSIDAEHDACAHPKHQFLVKADVLVSTPLLLLHAISPDSGTTPKSLSSVQHLVLDEADVLLDQHFREQTLGIWGACPSPSLNTSLWSATIGSSIESLAQAFRLDRQRKLGNDEYRPPSYMLRLVVGLKDAAIPKMAHRLVYAASEQGKLLGLRQLLHPATTAFTSTPYLQPPFLVFTQTIQRAIALHSELLYDIPPEAGGSSRIAVLHSDLSETARSHVMAGFRKGEIWILITTDLLSRGMDFRGMNGIVNYDIPNTGASYVHRAGRTGRQGREGGIAVTFYTKEDIPYVKNVANVIAASKRATKMPKSEGGGVQQWLLDALPDVSKKTRKDLKMKGVGSRRADAEGVDPRKLKKMRISTKSGYDRRLENRRKESRAQGRRRNHEPGSSDEGEFEGFAE